MEDPNTLVKKVVEPVEPTGEKSPEILALEERISKLEMEKSVLEEAHAGLVEQVETLSKLAYLDLLTGLKSRLAFDNEIKIYFDRIYKESHIPEQRKEGMESNESLVFVIFDIDKFKTVNDTLGHQAGDVVLRKVAKQIKGFTRGTDIVARWGGEEIVVAFIGMTPKEAEVKTDFIRKRIAKLEFDEYPDLRVTISAGLAHSVDFKNSKDLFKAADDALYLSKDGGRDKVTVHKPTEIK